MDQQRQANFDTSMIDTRIRLGIVAQRRIWCKCLGR